METPDNKIVSPNIGMVLLKVLFTLFSFIFSLYLIYPTMVLATEVDNIILADGKSPKPRIFSTTNGDYISLDELRREYLPQFTRINSCELTDKSSRSLIVIPGSLFIVSQIGSEQYVIQLSKPTFNSSANSRVTDIYISTGDIKTILTASMLYELMTLNDQSILKPKLLKSQTEIPEFKIITGEINEAFTQNPNDTKPIDNEIDEKIVVIENSNNSYVPSVIVNNSIFANHNKHSNSQFTVEEVNYSILPTAITVINNTREAFLALKPNSKKVLYLEPELLKSKTRNKDNKQEVKQDESLPPNLFTVPKGLFRRGIDR